MSVMVDRSIVVKERLDDLRHVHGGQDFRDSHVESGVDESGSGAVAAVYADGVQMWVVALDGFETSGKRVKVDECKRQRNLELVQEGLHEALLGVCLLWLDEEEALLDVMHGEHGEVPWRQVDQLL